MKKINWSNWFSPVPITLLVSELFRIPTPSDFGPKIPNSPAYNLCPASEQTIFDIAEKGGE